jgi:hypothetical protein
LPNEPDRIDHIARLSHVKKDKERISGQEKSLSRYILIILTVLKRNDARFVEKVCSICDRIDNVRVMLPDSAWTNSKATVDPPDPIEPSRDVASSGKSVVHSQDQRRSAGGRFCQSFECRATCSTLGVALIITDLLSVWMA